MGPTPGRAGGHFGSRPPPPNTASGAQCWRAWHQLVATHLGTSGCLHALWPGPTRHLWAMGPAPGGAPGLGSGSAPPSTTLGCPKLSWKLSPGIGPLAGPNWQNACCHPNGAGAHAAAHTTCGPLAWGQAAVAHSEVLACGRLRPRQFPRSFQEISCKTLACRPNCTTMGHCQDGPILRALSHGLFFPPD